MRPRRLAVALLLQPIVALILAVPLRAQRALEPQQLVIFGLGAGAVFATDAPPGFDPADDEIGLQLSAGLEIRQRGRFYVYVRGEADVLEIRQHLALSGGARVSFGSNRVRPFAGVGAGALFLQPGRNYPELDGRVRPRGELRLGVEGVAARGLYWLGELNLWASSYGVVSVEDGPPFCGTGVRCAVVADEDTPHFGVSLIAGARLKLF